MEPLPLRAVTRRSVTIRRMILILSGALCAAVFFGGLLSLLWPLPPLKPYSLVVEDRDGRFLQAFRAEDGIWRLRTSPAEIPERLKRILVLREDRWFYSHPGVNPLAIVRALAQNLRAGRRVSGASTITMQIARMLEPKERSPWSKLVEMFRALQLEWRYSKNELLEIYLSMVPLGGNIEGIRSAALLYYQTPLERLNIARLLDLILIPGNPNGLQPDRNGARLWEERTRHAAAWVRAGLLTREDSLCIWNTPAAARRSLPPAEAPHFALRVREQASGDHLRSPAGGGGDDVRSSLDLRLQKTVESLLSGHMRPWKLSGVQNGAVVVVRNATREVVAYAGSEDFRDEASHGQVDAVRALRSPGSTLKPLLYALAMDRGELTPRTRLLDTPYDAEGFLAENYDGQYSGWVYADEALRRSLNVPMVRLLHRTGMGPFLDLLRDAGFRSLQPQQARLGLSLILGGCGVTLEELTTAYAALANGGGYAPLRFTHSASPAASERQILSPSSAYMVTDILSGAERPDLPSYAAAAAALPRIAFKTGTSYGRRDAWCIGYSARYTVGVWIGNVTHLGNPELVGSRSAAPLLVDIFNSLGGGTGEPIMAAPRDLAMRLVCAESGLPPGDRCRQLIEDVYSRERSSTARCSLCAEYLVSAGGTTTYCTSCVADHPYTARTFLNYPPELRAFWRATGVSVAAPPPHDRACGRVFPGDGPSLVSPSDNTTYYLFSPRQRVTLQASSPCDVTEQCWYVNDRFLGRVRAGTRLLVHLEPGAYAVTCVDDKGRSTQVRLTIKRLA